MNAYATKTFKNGSSEAVRLPKEFAFGEGTEVELSREAGGVMIRRRWPDNAEVIAGLRKLPRPATIQEREPFEAPERPGL